MNAATLLARLVATPSVNPGKRAPAGPEEGEARMGAVLREILAGWGGDVEFQEVTPGRPNLLARFPGRDRSRSLMLEAHSDTVPPGEMSVPPYGGEIRDGKLYGRGACDDKGPMAAMLLGLKAALDAGPVPVDVWFVSTCDEELGAGGATALMRGGFRPTAAIVGEPTGLEVLTAHKGAARFRITTRGRSAHSSAPERGVNAVTMMGRVLDRIETVLRPALASRPHPELGPPTISVGTIRGGTQVNVVPDRCVIEIDRRIVPGETPAQTGEELQRILDDLRAADPVFEAERVNTEGFPPFLESRESPVAALAFAACRDTFGRAAWATAPWASNAGVFKAAGVPCVLFGPGSVRQAHAPDEHVELAAVEAAARAYAAMIRGAAALT